MSSAEKDGPEESAATESVATAMPEASASSTMSPGAQLRAAREERGLSVGDVADVLRFSKRQIELLEADRYDELPGATLVRGFVRGYAKLLKIDAEPLLGALTPEVPPTVLEVRPPANMGVANKSVTETPGDSSVPWGLILAGIVIVSAVGLVLFFVQKSGLGFDSLTTMFKSEPAPAGAAEQAAPTPAAVPVATPNADGKAEVAGAGKDAPLGSAGAAGAAGAMAATGTQAAVTEPTMPPTTPLLVEFDERSWIEVRDAMQKVVYVGEFPKGTRQVIEAQAPLQLWIGRASNVRASYGDRAIDLRPHTREDVARLTIE